MLYNLANHMLLPVMVLTDLLSSWRSGEEASSVRATPRTHYLLKRETINNLFFQTCSKRSGW